MKDLIRDTRVQRLMLANVTGSIGSGITIVAIPWLLVHRPGGDQIYGYATIGTTIALFLFMPHYGAWIDGHSRKTMLLAGELFGLAATTSMAAVAFLSGHVATWQLITSYVCGMTYYTLHYPAKYAFLQQIIESRHFQSLTGLMEIQGQAASMISVAGSYRGADRHAYHARITRGSHVIVKISKELSPVTLGKLSQLCPSCGAFSNYHRPRGGVMTNSMAGVLTTNSCAVECIAKGSPYEMGLAQGESLREKIRLSPGILERLESFRMAQPSWMPYSMFRRVCEMRAGRFLKEPLRRNFPDALQRMSGIAAGSGIPLRLLFLLHAMESMLADTRQCAALPGIGACSAVAVRGKRSATGEPIIARNFDYLPLIQPLCSLRESRPDSGFRSVDFTAAPFAGTFDGVNEKGLCITYDYAYVRDFGNSGAAPISIVIAEALEQFSTVAEAETWIRSRPRWGGAILMLADAEGDIASMELSNTRAEVRRPREGEDVIFHSNAFFTENMRSVQMQPEIRYTDKAPAALRGRSIHESSNMRDRRFQELLKGTEPLDTNSLQAIMADHENIEKPGGRSICTHSDYWNTTASVQLLPRSRRMRIAFASACSAKYSEHAL